MALKPDRIELADGSRIKYFMTETAERGIIVNLDANGGAGMDNPNATVSVPAGPSGNPAGVLMNDVVNLNLTRQHLNQQGQVQGSTARALPWVFSQSLGPPASKGG